MHVVRYRPADAIQWIEVALQPHASSFDFRAEGPESVRDAVLSAFGKLLDLSKETTAEVLLRTIRAIEYRLFDDHLEVQNLAGVKRYAYADLKTVELRKRDRFLFRGEGIRFAIRPYATLALTGVRLPLGWQREGLPVPYRLLAEEIALRSSVKVLDRRHQPEKPPKTR
ncbi:MAG: hypothetical protein KatS3mg015_0719 [Fimbriimonadales bacterium]|nr:MAG: hypothetical protein KatS3mg015_0719 [Fimbriimonadales bacterium]